MSFEKVFISNNYDPIVAYIFRLLKPKDILNVACLNKSTVKRMKRSKETRRWVKYGAWHEKYCKVVTKLTHKPDLNDEKLILGNIFGLMMVNKDVKMIKFFVDTLKINLNRKIYDYVNMLELKRSVRHQEVSYWPIELAPNKEIVEMFLAKGVEMHKMRHLSSANDFNKIATHYPHSIGLIEYVLFNLDSKSSINKHFGQEKNALFVAVKCSENVEILTHLLEKGGKLKCANSKMESLLHKAVYYKNYQYIKKFLELGLSVNFGNVENETPIFMVFKNTVKIERVKKIVKLLLKNGSRVTQKTKRKMSLPKLIIKEFCASPKEWREIAFEVMEIILMEFRDQKVRSIYTKEALQYCINNFRNGLINFNYTLKFADLLIKNGALRGENTFLYEIMQTKGCTWHQKQRAKELFKSYGQDYDEKLIVGKYV